MPPSHHELVAILTAYQGRPLDVAEDSLPEPIKRFCEHLSRHPEDKRAIILHGWILLQDDPMSTLTRLEEIAAAGVTDVEDEPVERWATVADVRAALELRRIVRLPKGKGYGRSPVHGNSQP